MSLRRIKPPSVEEPPPPTSAASLANLIWTTVRTSGMAFDVSDLSMACGTVQLWATLARAAQDEGKLAEMRNMLETFAKQHGTA